MDKVYILHYKKTFKSGEQTIHYKIGKIRENLFRWVQLFCEEHKLILAKSTNPDHDFIFSDGDWVYYGKSDYLNVEFTCYEETLI